MQARSTDRRPALDRLVKDARRRKFDVLVTWKLDRLGRNLKAGAKRDLLVEQFGSGGYEYVGDNGADLVTGRGLFVEPYLDLPRSAIAAGARIGIDYAG